MEEFKHRHTNDPFIDGIGEKLANHQMPVDTAVWKGIHQQLAPRKRLLPWWVITGLSAAAAIALVITVGNWFFQPAEESLLAEKESVSELVGQAAEQLQTQTTIQEQSIDHEKLLTQTLTHEHIELVALEQMQDQVLEPESKIESTVSEPEGTESTIQEPITTQTSLAHQLLLTDELPADWTDLREEDDKGILLAAGIGSGIMGSSLSHGGNKMYYDMSEGLSRAPMTYSASMRPEDFYNKDYMPPISVGLRVRKSISDKASVETGLLYSYLQTKLSGTSFGNYRAEMNLHYLGIPVSLGTTLLESSKWELSFFVGGMLEKGLWSVFRQDEMFANSTVTTVVNKKISGFQSSVHTSLGVSFKLDKGVDLYLDPVLSYYFDNSQPYSIRTAMPLMLSLQVGLRFNL